MPNDNAQPTMPTDVNAPSSSGAAAFVPDPASDVIVSPTSSDNAIPPEPSDRTPIIPQSGDPTEVARKISEASNILIALSKSPSVDELTAAIGLSIFLDKNGKHTTAIYSGATPNAIQFLNPEQTFEPTVDALQDFIIALNKDKADHLRYKVDGDYVKIFVTPYRAKISESDLEFSYGNYNVDLVIALNVANGADLDSALREHGRIMHDASIINITAGDLGKFGEIEWSNRQASSVSEMVAGLLYSIDTKEKIGKEEATAFLTGIVAATNRFSNAATTPDTMRLASRLMESGANQQLIAKHITQETSNEIYPAEPSEPVAASISKEEPDPTNLSINHNKENPAGGSSEEKDGVINPKESTLLEDLKAAEASLATAGAEVTKDESGRPIRMNSDAPAATKTEETPAEAPKTDASLQAASALTPTTEAPAIKAQTTESDSILKAPTPPAIPAPLPPLPAQPKNDFMPPVLPPVPTASNADKEIEPSSVELKSEKVISPPPESEMSTLNHDEDYGKMLEDALASSPDANPAAMSAPQVDTDAEFNSIPEIDYMPMPGEGVLPPPVTPPIDMNMEPASREEQATSTPAPAPAPTTPIAPAPTTSTSSPVLPASSGPAIPQVLAPVIPPVASSIPKPQSPQPQPQSQPQADPSAFKIPGM